LVLLLLTSVFELLPMCIIGAIIIAGVLSLVDYPEAFRLWQFDKLDFAVWAFTFLGVLFLGAEWGLLCGVALSFVVVVVMSAVPTTRVLGRLPGTELYRSIMQYPEAAPAPGCVVASTDAPLYFLNAQSVKDKVNQRALELDSETGVFTEYSVLDLTSSSDIDTCALHELDDWLLELGGGESGTAGGSDSAPDRVAPDGAAFPVRKLCLVNFNSTVMRHVEDWGCVDRLGRERLFCSVHDAVTWCLAELDEEAKSPAKGFAEISV
jgi:sulfate transporter 4